MSYVVSLSWSDKQWITNLFSSKLYLYTSALELLLNPITLYLIEASDWKKINTNDASIKRTEFDTGGSFKIFNLGIPISGIHIEDPGTEYADYVQIFCSIENIEYTYIIGIMNLSGINNNIFSKDTKAIIWYI